MHHNLSNDSTSNHSNMSDYSSVAPPQNFAQSSAYAAAVQRAQQIAAKMNSGITGTQDPQKKRSLEDGPEPEAKKIAPVIPDPLANLRGNTTPGIPTSIAESTKPAGSTTPNPVPLGICNEDIRVPDKMVGLIIGRGGEQITRLQSETGCKIQMAAESGGLPERTCTLTGSRDAVNRAKELVQSIVSQRNKPEDQIPGANPPYPGPPTTTPTTPTTLTGHPGFVEIMIPGPKVGLIIGKGGETIKQLQEKSGAKMVVIQEGPAQEQEKPLRITGDPQKVEHAKQLVYELIAEKEMQMYNRGTRNSFSGNNSFSQDGGSTAGDGVEVFVPKDAVGVVIGKGGDMIKKLQQETGAKIQFIQLKGEGPGDRTCSISGASDCVETARQRIQDMIDSVLKGRNNPRGNGFNSTGRPNEYGGGWDNRRTDMTNKIEFSYPVPSNKCGIIIGKGGETIKQINQQTGAHCELDRRNPGTETDKFFTIRGTPEQVEHAKRIFAEKLGGGMTTPNSMYGAQNTMGFNPSWNAAPGYQAWPGQTPATDPNAANQGQVQINPATGQPDYSAQWAEYYRSLGMHREAEMIEQQAKQQQAAAAAAAKPEMSQQAAQQPNPAPTNPTQQQPQQQQQSQQQQQQGAQQNGGQADYSAQWAEYYRSIGKIEEAEAIEAQMKNRKTSGGMQSNQMGQSQQQPQQSQMQPNPMSNQGGAPGGPGPGGAPNAFPQPYGGYPGMNPASGGYYTPAGQPTSGQPAQPGQQNSAFPTTGYQNYQYPQASSDN